MCSTALILYGSAHEWRRTGADSVMCSSSWSLCQNRRRARAAGCGYGRGMRMAVGTRVGPMGPGDLAAAYPWPAAGSWLRVMMVMTLDGAVAGADGRSGSISSKTDREVLAEVRRLSDAILVGAATVRAEPYAPLRARPEAAAERASLGLAPAPVIVVVSRSLDLPWDAPMFGASTVRPMVVTTESAGKEGRRVAREHADLLVLPGDRVEPQRPLGPPGRGGTEAPGVRRRSRPGVHVGRGWGGRRGRPLHLPAAERGRAPAGGSAASRPRRLRAPACAHRRCVPLQPVRLA